MASARRDLLNYAQFLKESGYLYVESASGAKQADPAAAPASVSPPAVAEPARARPTPAPMKPEPTPDLLSAAPAKPAPPRAAAVPKPPPPAAPKPAVAPLALAERDARAAEASARVAACTACQLCRTRTQTVYGTGSLQARIVFIGEGPGAEEDRTGIPFVGRAGQLLDKMIAAIGFRRDEVYICNTVKCRPPENRDPEPAEKRACEPFLHEQIEIIQPQMIVALGAHAAVWLTGQETSIGRLRKKWHEYRGIPVMATYHPAFLLRSPHMKTEAWADMLMLSARYNELNPGDARKVWGKGA